MDALPIGIVGAGRSRNGLGPFLARCCERSGLCVAGIAGRDAQRTAAVAQAFAGEFGHPVAVHADARALAGSGIAALVVATPPEHHLEGLEAALRSGIACLCEKPLVGTAQADAGAAAVAAFAAAGLLLVENCQWPFVLPALRELHPELPAGPPRRVAMGLSPSRPGIGMVTESLSHLLSLVQALVPAGSECVLLAATLDDPAPAATANVLRLRLSWGDHALDAELHLRQCPAPPRPAWLAVDGLRMDRRIGEGHAISFAAAGRVVAVVDPMAQLVAAFAGQLRAPEPERAQLEQRRIAERLRLYAQVLAATLGTGGS